MTGRDGIKLMEHMVMSTVLRAVAACKHTIQRALAIFGQHIIKWALQDNVNIMK